MTTTPPAPTRPTAGTDNARMLDALIAAAPDFAWNLDKALDIKANSRAAVLRKLGWRVEYQSRPRVGGNGRKRDHGYRLLNAPTQDEAAA